MHTIVMTTRLLLCAALVVLTVACAPNPTHQGQVMDRINQEFSAASEQRPVDPLLQAPPAGRAQRSDELATDALLPPLQLALPSTPARQLDPRFDLVVNSAPAAQVLMSIVSGTRYQMLVHPDISSNVTVHLKDVTVFEALDALRDLYNLDYRVEGSRITVQPQTLQTRVMRINYIAGRRTGSSDLRVTSTSVANTGTGGTGAQNPNQNLNQTAQQNPQGTPGVPGSPANAQATTNVSGSRVSSQSNADFWQELERMLTTIIGDQDGRSVVLSPHSGIIVIRALPSELRVVEDYLRKMQLAINRQVILEAKILEVQLKDDFSSGINWGAITRNVAIASTPMLNAVSGGGVTGAQGTTLTLSSATGATLTTGQVPAINTLGKGMFSLAFMGANFGTLIEFLETQGKVNVLSSPRIATLNNQKAVLKVGSDEFFVTNISVTQTTGTATTNTPSVTLQPFFSGIALDVTPQVDDDDNVMLHVHPSISVVAEKTKTINAGLGSALVLPLASSTISETDSVIRARDGQMVVIGGLMSYAFNNEQNRIPGTGDMPGSNTVFGSTRQSLLKRELVILLKPTVINSDEDWSRDIAASRERARRLDPPSENSPLR